MADTSAEPKLASTETELATNPTTKGEELEKPKEEAPAV